MSDYSARLKNDILFHGKMIQVLKRGYVRLYIQALRLRYKIVRVPNKPYEKLSKKNQKILKEAEIVRRKVEAILDLASSLDELK